MIRTVESVRLQLQRGIFSEDDAHWLIAEIELARALIETERKFRLEAENSLGEERELVRRLRADLEYERQLHRDAAAEVERLRAEAANLVSLRPIETLHEDHGVVLLWTFREDGGCDAPGIGSSIDDWFDQNDYTHWSPIPNPKHEVPMALVRESE